MEGDYVDPLHSAAVLMLAVAAEDGHVEPAEMDHGADALTQWGRCDRVAAAGQIQAAFQLLGELWQAGGVGEVERQMWVEASTLAQQLNWYQLRDLVGHLQSLAGADGQVDGSETTLVNGISDLFDLECGPPEDMAADELLLRFSMAGRGPLWIERFHEAIATALVEVGEPGDPHATDPRVVRGPDGFHYAEARVRRMGGLEVPFRELARWCTDEGYGIALHPDRQPPDFVFSYGHLWSLRAYDSFDGDGVEPPMRSTSSEAVFDANAEILMGTPSEEMLPHFAREALARMFEGFGMPSRQVALLMVPDRHPSRTLVFDVAERYMPDPSSFRALLDTLSWYAPPGLALAAVDPEGQSVPFLPL